MGGAVEYGYAPVEGGGRIAYQVVGDGPLDVLVVPPPVFPVDMMWDEPHVVRFLDRLSSFCRHVWFDARGTGSSDWISHAEGRLIESHVDDMVAVLDALGWERVAIIGLGTPAGVVFAATHPDRTSALVWWRTRPCGLAAATITRSGCPTPKSIAGSQQCATAARRGAWK